MNYTQICAHALLVNEAHCFSFVVHFENLYDAAMFLLERRGFLMDTLLNKPDFFSLFPTVNFNMLTEASQSEMLLLGFLQFL